MRFTLDFPQEISAVLGGGVSIDDADVLAEFQALEQEEADQIAQQLPAVPVAEPTVTRKPAVMCV